jgi:transposase
MEPRDFRGIGRDAQEALRERAVYLVVREGKSQQEAATAVGASRQIVNQWVKRHRQSGARGLLDGRRISSRKGRGSLTAGESRRIQGWIKDKCPDQMKLPFALWTAQAVRELIRWKFRKELGLSTVQLYLQRWGFTPRKPVARARQRCPRKIASWLEKDYPAIQRRAKREKAAIFWGDETGINNQDRIGRGYAPKGQTPVLRHTARKFSTSMISAISNRGVLRFRLYKGALNVNLFIDFLRRLVRDAGQKVFLIVDNPRVHHAKSVMEWIAKHKSRIAIFYLPAYAPEHNPDEYLNNDLKQQMKNKPRANDRKALVATTLSILKSIQRRPGRVRSYFRAKHVAYAS